jgi:TonB family protein
MNRLAGKLIIVALGFALGLAASFAWNRAHPPAVPNCGQGERASAPLGDDDAMNAAPLDDLRLVSAFEEHINRKLISKPTSVYPPEAKAAGISGDVAVGVIINETGNVAYAWAESGQMPLTAAAVDAAYKLRCKPTFIGGKPVSVKSVVTYKFVMP